MFLGEKGKNTGSCKIVSFVVLFRVIRPAQKGWYRTAAAEHLV